MRFYRLLMLSYAALPLLTSLAHAVQPDKIKFLSNGKLVASVHDDKTDHVNISIIDPYEMRTTRYHLKEDLWFHPEDPEPSRLSHNGESLLYTHYSEASIQEINLKPFLQSAFSDTSKELTQADISDKQKTIFHVDPFHFMPPRILLEQTSDIGQQQFIIAAYPKERATALNVLRQKADLCRTRLDFTGLCLKSLEMQEAVNEIIFNLQLSRLQEKSTKLFFKYAIRPERNLDQENSEQQENQPVEEASQEDLMPINPVRAFNTTIQEKIQETEGRIAQLEEEGQAVDSSSSQGGLSLGTRLFYVMPEDKKVTHSDIPFRVTHIKQLNETCFLLLERQDGIKHAYNLHVFNKNSEQLFPITLSKEDNVDLGMALKTIVRQGKVFIQTYAGKNNNTSRILSFDPSTKAFKVVFTPKEYDIQSFSLNADLTKGHVILNQQGIPTLYDIEMTADGTFKTTTNPQPGILKRKYGPQAVYEEIEDYTATSPGQRRYFGRLKTETAETIVWEDAIPPLGEFQAYYQPVPHEEGFDIPCYVYHNGDQKREQPLIVHLHGGPTAHQTIAYMPLVHSLLSKGYNLVDIQYPGSTGFGKPYLNQLFERRGDIDAQSIKAVVDHLVQQGIANRHKVMVLGHSYGAYLSVVAAMQYPELFVGVAALSGFYGHDKKKTDAEEDSAALREKPIQVVHTLKVPIFLAHGIYDDVCQVEESEHLAHDLLKSGHTNVQLHRVQAGHALSSPQAKKEVLAKLEEFVDGVMQDSARQVPLSSHKSLGHSVTVHSDQGAVFEDE